MISPSAGMTSRAATSTTSPFFRFSAGTWTITPSGLSRLAGVFVRVFRSSLAWALPRPSAMASAKLAKRTVNQSQSEIWTTKPRGSFPEPRKRAAVVRIAPTSVTKMTGFLSSPSGFSFLKESTVARPMIRRSNGEWICLAMLFSASTKGTSPVMTKCSTTGPRARAGRNVRAPTIMTVPRRIMMNIVPPTGKRASPAANAFLPAMFPARAMHRHQHREPAEKHGQGERYVISRGVAVQAGKGAAVVPRGGRVGIEDLAQAMGAGVIQAEPGPSG